VVGTCGSEQHRLHRRPEWLGRAGQEYMAHRLAAGRTARLARDNDFAAFRLQTIGQKPDLRRLARPLAALEGDEMSSWQCASFRRSPTRISA
jgi:hypothetical protein